MSQALADSIITGPYQLGLDPNRLSARPGEPVFTRSLGVDGDPGGNVSTVRIINTRVSGFDAGIFLNPGGADITNCTLNNFRDIYVPWAAQASAR